jgi:hypothetical protein
VPPTRSVSIAASTAQNDAGVFELSFRDERYMPFEGLGAVESQWHLTLPKAFRQFDYETINDVILSINYTAEQDGVLRQRVESQSAAGEENIVDYFSNHPAGRLLSLRQDFSSAFVRLLRSPVNTPVKLEFTERHFPLFFRSRNLKVTRAVLLLRTSLDQPTLQTALKDFSLTMDATNLGPAPNAFVMDTASNPQFGGLPFCDKLPVGADPRGQERTLSIQAPGGLAPTSPQPGDVSAVDPAKLLDILVYLEYQLG